MNFCMKKIIISALLLLVAVTGYSQDRKWEHNIYVAGGLLIDREWGESETGVSMKLGYGLNYYFDRYPPGCRKLFQFCEGWGRL